MYYSTPHFISNTFGYGSFGMALVGRSWSVGSEYRYGFNGKENYNEIGGSNNVVDYGSRFYECRLGRWFSVDPLYNKTPFLSPYSGLANNPILFLDLDGRENVVYVNFLTSSSTTLTLAEKDAMIAEAQRIYTDVLKLNVKVVEYDEKLGGTFDESFMDKTDVVVFVGNPNEVCDFASANVADQKSINNWDDWNKKENPERSENNRYTGTGIGENGQVVAINSDALSTHGDFGAKSEQEFGGYLIVHGSGHNANMNHQGYDMFMGVMVSNTSIMAGGEVIQYTLNPAFGIDYGVDRKEYNNLSDWVNSPSNAGLTETFKKKFSGESPKVNYYLNQAKSTPGYQEPCGQPTQTEIQN